MKERPDTYTLPDADALGERLAALIESCQGQFASPAVTELQWGGDRAAGKKTKAASVKE